MKIYMNKKIDYECYKRIIQGTYKKFTLMEKNNWTKATTINDTTNITIG